ncbi:MAG: flagellar basal body-associated FliL family protein [Alphaproteobacteria bacterium]|nr:flagellar basal body-associated FliL family protein [Alphaproteobacteria bacterium]
MMVMMTSIAHASEKKAKGNSSEYVKLAPLLLPIIDENGVQQVVSMIVAIEVDGSNAERVKEISPRLTDAYIQSMYGILNRHAALKGGIIQVRMIKEHLNRITDEVLGDEIDTEVLLQHVQQRPI